MDNIEAEKLIKKLANKDLMQKSNYLHQKDHIPSILKIGEEGKTKALVSIIIPAYRRPNLFCYTLNSIINQKLFSDFQIIIADDSGDMADEYEKIVRENADPRIRYYKNSERLGWYNWNRLLELADTEWVCMVHDDDVLCEKHLYYMKKLLDGHPDADMMVCDRVFMQGEDHHLRMCDGDLCQIKPQKGNVKELNFRFASFMLGAWIRRDKAVELGGFNDEIISLDYEFVAKMMLYHTVYSSSLRTYGYGVKENESMKDDMWEKMLISEFFIANSITGHRSFFIRHLLRGIENYSIACHAEDMSHPSKNIYGVEMDAKRLCRWLGVDYSLKDSLFWKTIMKLYNIAVKF